MKFIFASLFILVLIAVHYLVYRTAVNAFVIDNRRTSIALYSVLALLTLSFIVMTIVASRYYNVLVRVLYTASAVWLGILFYLFLASFIYWLIVWLFRQFAPGLNLETKIVYEALLVLVIAVCVYGTISAVRIKAKEVALNLPNMPEQWKGKRAIWISDLHLGDVRNLSFSESLVKQIQNFNPEVVFIGGDFYDGVAVDTDALAKSFAKVQAPKGVYFITGNHEEFTKDRGYVNALSKAGIKVLNNEMVNLDGLQVIGVDYVDSSDPKKLAEILDGLRINSSFPSVLLKHVPDALNIPEERGVSLQLSGHTHHGQLWPVGYLTRAVFKGYDFGLKKYGNMEVYTSDGVGTWGVPMRVGADPEFVILKF